MFYHVLPCSIVLLFYAEKTGLRSRFKKKLVNFRMKKSDFSFYAAMAILLFVGFWLRQFFGGILIGAAAVLLPVVLVGRVQARKAGKVIDKRVRDILINYKED